jgi:hypothetical protein
MSEWVKLRKARDVHMISGMHPIAAASKPCWPGGTGGVCMRPHRKCLVRGKEIASGLALFDERGRAAGKVSTIARLEPKITEKHAALPPPLSLMFFE